jgi:DNA primase
MGTALTLDQAERLRRLCPRAILCYDGDSAGRKATGAALSHLLSLGFEASVAKLPGDEDPDDFLLREGPEALARSIEEAPDSLTWLIEDVRPEEPGIASGEKRERLGVILAILGAIPDRILRYEEYRKLSSAVAVPLEVLWGADKANLQAPSGRSIGVGTPGNEAALSGVAVPLVEKRLLQVLSANQQHNALILNNLSDDLLTDTRVKRVVAAFRKAASETETVDFQRQIADLTEEERTFLSGVALDESPEPTEKGVEQLLKDLEKKHLERESAEIQKAIDLAGTGSGQELMELLRRKQEISRRKAELGRSPRWKGNELGD